MNPGPAEEIGHTARGLIDALKAQPAVLALTVAVGGMLIFQFYALYQAAQFRDNMVKGMQAESRHVNDLLSKCVVPGG